MSRSNARRYAPSTPTGRAGPGRRPARRAAAVGALVIGSFAGAASRGDAGIVPPVNPAVESSPVGGRAAAPARPAPAPPSRVIGIPGDAAADSYDLLMLSFSSLVIGERIGDSGASAVAPIVPAELPVPSGSPADLFGSAEATPNGMSFASSGAVSIDDGSAAVVEDRADVVLLPLPSAGWTGLLGLSGLAAANVVRRVRRWARSRPR